MLKDSVDQCDSIIESLELEALRKKNIAKDILDHVVEPPVLEGGKKRKSQRQLVKHLTSDEAIAVLEAERLEKMLKYAKQLTAKKRKDEEKICQKCKKCYTEGEQWIECGDCKKWYHILCTEVKDIMARMRSKNLAAVSLNSCIVFIVFYSCYLSFNTCSFCIKIY